MKRIILVKGADLFDPVAKTIRAKTNILIEEDKVSKVSRDEISLPPGCRVIEAAGSTVIPGLMNLHSHPQRRHAARLDPSAPFRIGAAAVEDLPDTFRMVWAIRNIWTEMLGEGVTTIRAAGSKNLLNIELRDLIESRVIKGPRIIASGPIIATTGGHATVGINGAMEADGADEVRKAVRMVLKAGADWIKLCVSGGLAGIHKGEHPSMVQFTFDEVSAAVDEAHRKNRKVMVHCMASQGAEMAIKAGVDCIEHGDLLSSKVIALMKANNISFVPTISGIYKVYEREKNKGNTIVANLLRDVVLPQKDVVSASIKAGILIGTGTDTLGSIVDEIKMFVDDCGMSAAGAIATATIDSARILGREKELGSVEKGKKADLVILRGNPLKNLDALKQIVMVFIYCRKIRLVGLQHISLQALTNIQPERGAV